MTEELASLSNVMVPFCSCSQTHKRNAAILRENKKKTAPHTHSEHRAHKYKRTSTTTKLKKKQKYRDRFLNVAARCLHVYAVYIVMDSECVFLYSAHMHASLSAANPIQPRCDYAANTQQQCTCKPITKTLTTHTRVVCSRLRFSLNVLHS